MKKTLLTLGFIGAIAFANAQTSQGTWMLGGGAGLDFGSSKNSSTLAGSKDTDGPSTTSWNLSPNVGYFVIDKLAVGLELDLSGSSSTVKAEGTAPGPVYSIDVKSSNMNWALGPFARYYFMFGDNMGIFVHAGIGFGGMSGSHDDLDFTTATPSVKSVDNDKVSTFSYKVGPGLAIFLNESVALEASLLYNGVTNTTAVPAASPIPAYDAKNTASNFGLNIGFQIHLGSK